MQYEGIITEKLSLRGSGSGCAFDKDWWGKVKEGSKICNTILTVTCISITPTGAESIRWKTKPDV